MGLNKEEIEKLENDYLKDIPYLIKFQGNNDKYAKSLLQQGDLFMQSAAHYRRLEQETGIRGQGDAYDNLLFGCLSIDDYCPVYCMYAVYNTQVKEGKIFIDKKVIKDFCKEGGYITICKTVPFVEQFNKKYEKRYDIGLINYITKTEDQDFKLLVKNRGAHFYKSPNLEYQQEFRLVLDERLQRKTLSKENAFFISPNGQHYYISSEYETKNFEMGSIESFSEQVKTKDLELIGDKNIINIRKLKRLM